MAEGDERNTIQYRVLQFLRSYGMIFARSIFARKNCSIVFEESIKNEENRGRNRYDVERFLCAYYISAGQTSLLQVQ